MLAIIPSANKTFEVRGYLDDEYMLEGKLYADRVDGTLYMFSLRETRPNPNTGFFPIWNGDSKITSKFAISKSLTDAMLMDLPNMSKLIDADVSKDILYKHRRSANDKILDLTINSEDNMFTQCVKGVINAKRVTFVDLADMSNPPVSELVIQNYCAQLDKISFMRLEKWDIWINSILHVSYIVRVYDDGKEIVTYKYPSDEYIWYNGKDYADKISNKLDSPFKKLINILFDMQSITKASLRSATVTDYTINNMLTTLSKDHKISSQIFGRFIRMSNLQYSIHLYDGDTELFSYKES